MTYRRVVVDICVLDDDAEGVIQETSEFLEQLQERITLFKAEIRDEAAERPENAEAITHGNPTPDLC